MSPENETFTPDDWSRPRTVTVRGVDDHTADGSRAYSIIIPPAQSGDPDYGGRDPPDLLLFNVDNERRAEIGGDFTVEVRPDGTLWTWDGNFDGELGNGTSEPTNIPARIGTDAD